MICLNIFASSFSSKIFHKDVSIIAQPLPIFTAAEEILFAKTFTFCKK